MGIYADPNSGNYDGFYGYPGQADARGFYGMPGQEGSPYVNATKPGFFSGAWGLISPFTHTPLHQTPGDESDPYYTAVGTRPIDAAATVAQRVVVPGLAVLASQRYLGANTGSLLGDIAAPFRGQGAAAAFGKGLGTGAASRIISGLGGSAAGPVASRMVGAAGALGGAAAGIGLPLVVAEGLAKAANYTVFDAYVSTRQEASDLRRNLYGVSSTGVEGDVTRGGKGLSASEATSVAQGITRAGIQDYSFDLDQYGDIANLLGKSGALDSASAKRIVERVKSASEQIKLIVQISKDPSIQKAVEELSKLQLAGASLDGGRLGIAGQAYSQLGMYASAAGTSVQRLMSGVGAQGQSMFGSMGMTPYLGQLAAGNVYSGFASAYRSGLVSEGMMSRMGGIENATRTSLTGSMTAAQSPMMQMLMFNTLAGKGGVAGAGGSQTPTGILSTFGQTVARDPLTTMGMQILLGPQMMEKFMQNDTRNIEETIVNHMRTMGVQPAGKEGKFTIQQMAPFLQGYMGMDPEQIRNFANRRLTETNAATIDVKNKGLRGQAKEETLQYIESQGLVNTLPARIGHGVRSAVRGVRQAANAYVAEPLSRAAGAFQTSVTEAVYEFQYGNTLSQPKEVTVEDLEGNVGLTKRGWEEVKPKGFHNVPGESKDLLAPYKGFDFSYSMAADKISAAFSMGTSNAEIQKILSTIQGLAQTSGHPAQDLSEKFMKTANRGQRGAILSDLLRSHPEAFPEGAYNRLFVESDEYLEVLNQAISSQVAEVRVRQNPTYNQRALGRSVEDVLGESVTSAYSGMQAMGSVMKLGELIASGQENEATIDRYVESDPALAKIVGGKRGKEASEHLLGVYNKIRGSGMAAQGALASQMGDVSKLDPSSIKSKAHREKFLAASTVAEKEKVAASYVASMAAGGSKISPGANYTWKQNAEALRPGLTASKAATKSAEDAASSTADYTQYKAISDALEKPIGDFQKGVEAFAKAVGRMPGAQATTDPTATNTDGGYWSSFGSKPGDAFLLRGLEALKNLGAKN